MNSEQKTFPHICIHTQPENNINGTTIVCKKKYKKEEEMIRRKKKVVENNTTVTTVIKICNTKRKIY